MKPTNHFLWAQLCFDGTAPHYPQAVFAPGQFDLRLGRSHCILGASGIGKTSLLRLLLPSKNPIPQLQWHKPAPSRVAYLEQRPALLPYKTLRDNTVLGDTLRGTAPDFARSTALLERMGLDARAQKAYPPALSGGMQQRAGLARCLYEQAELVLLDEPFSALDTVRRLSLQDLAGRMLAGKTLVLITHDPLEAARLGQDIWLLHPAPDNPGRASMRRIIEDNRPLGRAHDDPLVLRHAATLTQALLTHQEAML